MHFSSHTSESKILTPKLDHLQALAKALDPTHEHQREETGNTHTYPFRCSGVIVNKLIIQLGMHNNNRTDKLSIIYWDIYILSANYWYCSQIIAKYEHRRGARLQN